MLKRKVHVKIPVVGWAESWAMVDVPLTTDQPFSLEELINADPDAQADIEENAKVTEITALRWLDLQVTD